MIDDFTWENRMLSFYLTRRKKSPADCFVTVLSISFRN